MGNALEAFKADDAGRGLRLGILAARSNVLNPAAPGARAALVDLTMRSRPRRIIQFKEPVQHVLFVAEGKILVTLTIKGAVQFWAFPDVSSIGAISLTSELSCIALSHDGSKLLAVSVSGAARMFSVPSGAPLDASPRDVGWRARNCEFSFDDSRVLMLVSHQQEVIDDDDHTLAVWEVVQSGGLGRKLPNEIERISALSVRPGTNDLMLRPHSTSLRFATLGPNGPELVGKEYSVRAARYSDDGSHIAIIFGLPGYPSRISVLDSGVELPEHEAEDEQLDPMARVFPNRSGSAVIVSSVSEEQAEVRKFPGGDATEPFRNASTFVPRFSPDDRLLLTASASNAITVRDQKGNAIGEPFKHGAQINDAVFSPNGRSVVTASDDQSVAIWDVPRPPHLDVAISIDGLDSIDSIKLNADVLSVLGRRRKTYERNELVLQRRDLVTRRLLEQELVIDVGGKSGRAWLSPDAKRIITRDESLRLWDAESGHPIDSSGCELLASRVRSDDFLFAPNGYLVLRHGNAVQTCDPQDGRAIRSPVPLQQPPGSRALSRHLLSPDGSVVAAFSTDAATAKPDGPDQLLLWDAYSGRSLGAPVSVQPALSDYRSYFAFDPSGRYVLVVTKAKHEALLVSTARSRQIETFKVPCKGAVSGVAFSGNGRYFAVFCESGEVEIRSASDRFQVISSLNAQSDPMVLFSADGRVVLTRGKTKAQVDEDPQLWDTETGRQLGNPMQGYSFLDGVQLQSIGDLAFSGDGRTLVGWYRASVSIRTVSALPYGSNEEVIAAVCRERLGPESYITDSDRRAAPALEGRPEESICMEPSLLARVRRLIIGY